jgi:hypothetical protein
MENTQCKNEEDSVSVTVSWGPLNNTCVTFRILSQKQICILLLLKEYSI